MEMTKREYAQEIANRVGGEVKEVEKVKGHVLTGISIMNGNVAPTFYIDEMYDDGVDLDRATGIVDRSFKNADTNINIDWVMDWDQVKENLYLALYGWNVNAEVIRSAAEYGFDDLVLVPYILCDKIGGTIKVRKELIEKWGVTEDTVYKVAMGNTKFQMGYSIGYMEDTLGGLIDPSMLPEGFDLGIGGMVSDVEDLRDYNGDFEMLVITNKDKVFGAIGVILALDGLKKKYPNGFIVVPSSIHEVIIAPKGRKEDLDAFAVMVGEVNDQEVAPEQRLSDHAYFIR
jgi:hypothetical protein